MLARATCLTSSSLTHTQELSVQPVKWLPLPKAEATSSLPVRQKVSEQSLECVDLISLGHIVCGLILYPQLQCTMTLET